MTAIPGTWVVARGELLDGFQFYGPFDSSDKAIEFIKRAEARDLEQYKDPDEYRCILVLPVDVLWKRMGDSEGGGS